MGLIPEEVISQVLERNDIVQIISAYLPLKKAGRNFKANCPFHNEKTPSFVVNPDKQIFHCFGCGTGGNAISFVMQQERLEFPEAIRMLAQKVGITIAEDERQDFKEGQIKPSIYKANSLAAEFFHQNLLADPSAKEARDYLKSRGINLEIVKKFKVGFALDQWDRLIHFLKKQDVTLNTIEKAGLIVARENKQGFYDRFRNRITFPIFDLKGQCVAFGARALGQTNQAKYINSPETPAYVKGQHLYGLYLSKEAVIRQDSVVVVEGYMDFIIPYQAGTEHIVASLGTALTVEQIRLIRRFTQNVIMLFDSDQAGESAIVRSLDLLIEEGMNVKVATLPKGHDPDSYVRNSGGTAFQQRLEDAQSFFDFKLLTLIEKYDDHSVDGRTHIAMEMLPTVNKFDNSIKRFGYLKQLAERLYVPEQALLMELDKLASKKTPSPTIKSPTPYSGSRKVELELLKLLLEKKDFIALVKNEVQLSDFQDPHIKWLINRIFELNDQEKDINFQILLQNLNDPKAVQKLSGLMASDDHLVGDPAKMLEDYLNRLKKDRINQEKRNLNRQLYEAQMNGDQNRVREITKIYNQLIKR